MDKSGECVELRTDLENLMGNIIIFPGSIWIPCRIVLPGKKSYNVYKKMPAGRENCDASGDQSPDKGAAFGIAEKASEDKAF